MASLLFAIVVMLLNLVLTFIFVYTSIRRLFDKYVDKEIRNKVKSQAIFVVRRMLIVALLLSQDYINSFEVSFTIFSINCVFISINMRYAQSKLDFIYYCVSEFAVVVFGFIIISFTSYNLDIHDKQTIGIIGISIILAIYSLLVSLRIYEIVKYYKLKKLNQVKIKT
jgi:hypothetical protein